MICPDVMQCAAWIFRLCLFASLCFTTDVCTGAEGSSSYLVYIGTYTGPKSKGIYGYRYETGTGKLQSMGVAAEVENPSWLTLHPNGKFLYAVSELGDAGETQGAISSFAVDGKTGALQLLNKVASGGGGACHLVVDKTGKFIAVANYGSGSVAIFRLDSSGRLGERTALVQLSGSSVNPKRQKGPHAHAVVLSADNRFLFVPDLGTDKIMSYRFNSSDGSLTPNTPPFTKVEGGSGPRHFAFAPSGKFAYLLNEMGSRVTTFSYDAQNGTLKELQNISTLTPDFKAENNSAEIQIDRKGRFLYASNRGDDSIAVFAIDPKNGTLSKVQRASTGGNIPRNFALDPAGARLLAANQKSDKVVVFKVDPQSGELSPTGEVINVASPVCIQFVMQ
jgi:6-phosphogluconolactonase